MNSVRSKRAKLRDIKKDIAEHQAPLQVQVSAQRPYALTASTTMSGSRRRRNVTSHEESMEQGDEVLPRRSKRTRKKRVLMECSMATGENHSSGMDGHEARTSVQYVPSPHTFERLQQSQSLTHFLYTASLGVDSAVNRKSVLSPVVRRLKDLHLSNRSIYFGHVTALDWHPAQPDIVVAGSKEGSVVIWETRKDSFQFEHLQFHPANTINAVKGWPWNRKMAVVATGCTVSVESWKPAQHQVLSDLCNSGEQYVSLDVSATRKVVAAGDNEGNTQLMSHTGQKLWNHHLHERTVTHVEFSPRQDWLLCTASADCTVKMWDVRCIRGQHSALCELKHKKPVNSAYFSRTDGRRLLTTDMCRQIQVYCAPHWHLEQTFKHGHGYLMSMEHEDLFTPDVRLIKATWHPLQDLVVVGCCRPILSPFDRPTQLRAVDIFSADTGKRVYQLSTPSSIDAMPMNQFDDSGDYLVSGMKEKLRLWKPFPDPD